MAVPWEERGRNWAVAIGQMEIRCLQGHSEEGVAEMSCWRSQKIRSLGRDGSGAGLLETVGAG